jgi:vesicle coat complex subunit
MELITSTDVVRNLCKKMAPPLVTLLSAEPEIQYVALRNINLIAQKRPTILAHEIKVIFFICCLCRASIMLQGVFS